MLLLPLAMMVGACSTLPENGARTIEFSGYRWIVKNKPERAGPGPNYFSDARENVWVDEAGKLHVRITRQKDKWRCSEVICSKKLGYGEYRLYIDGYVDRMDPNVVLALFTWDSGPGFANREIDIEFSRWGKKERANAQYVIQNVKRPSHKKTFDLRLKDRPSVHSLTWTRDRVAFESFLGSDRNEKDLIQQWEYEGKGIPRKGNETPRINLWLFRGNPPTDLKEVEVVISKFEFLPAR